MDVYWEVLPEKVRMSVEFLAEQPWAGEFYLAGGTGVALQLGHRTSLDLDLFSEANRLTFEERQHLMMALKAYAKTGSFQVALETEGTLTLILQETSVSFFHYPYLLVSPLIPLIGRLHMATLEDIGLMKIAAIIGRGRKRDFVDLYFITRQVPLARLMELGAAKFPHVRDFAAQAARALVYFADADKERMLRMRKRVTWQMVKRYFEGEVRRLSREWIRPGSW